MVLAALCGTDGGSCHFRVHFNLRTSGSVWYRRPVVSLSCTFQRAVVAARRGTDGVVYLPIYAKLGLVVGMTQQMSDGKEVDIVN